jgi:hypothetical protein
VVKIRELFSQKSGHKEQENGTGKSEHEEY